MLRLTELVKSEGYGRQLLSLELTVPWEERMEEAQERKRAKYQEKWWRTVAGIGGGPCVLVEVGSCGFEGHSLSKAYRTMGIKGPSRR
ncbi:Adenylosuccinate synthetase [Dissostichus eleginoides]|uniref:Adenylosuccinate synthetase n=1 Tax=Dissostichus eleginoides TaxID=100907 RepID=A0AAD9FKV8_DISEL|nr:Adenylosuccinate synthetase [Dissostichus eleginoides]